MKYNNLVRLFLKHSVGFVLKNRLIRKLSVHLGIKSIMDYSKQHGLIDEFDHYKDEYWNELDSIQKYINRNATGNSCTTWQIDILSRFKTFLPFEKCLVIGCGTGWVERELYDLKIGKSFEAFDYSEKYLTIARKNANARNIKYFIADINNLINLPESYYDAIFNVGVLHHTFRISKALWKLSKSLKSNGLMFNFDYVGPPRQHYTNDHLQTLKEINNVLPKRFKNHNHLRSEPEDVVFGDSSEAVNSDLVRPIFYRFFNILYERELNGGIGYQILLNNIKEFKAKDSEAVKALDYIIQKDNELSKSKKIPVLFWYSVGSPKLKKEITFSDLLEY